MGAYYNVNRSGTRCYAQPPPFLSKDQFYGASLRMQCVEAVVLDVLLKNKQATTDSDVLEANVLLENFELIDVEDRALGRAELAQVSHHSLVGVDAA